MKLVTKLNRAVPWLFLTILKHICANLHLVDEKCSIMGWEKCVASD